MDLKEIKALRARHGYNQEVVAKALNLTTPNYSSKENGYTKFSCDEMLALAKFFNLDLKQTNDFIFDGKLPSGTISK